MKEAELEASGIGAVDAVLRRHLDFQSAVAALQLGRGEISPAPLKAAQHDDLDAEHRLHRHPRRAGLTPKAQPVSALGQVEIGTIKKAPRRLAPTNPGCSVRLSSA